MYYLFVNKILNKKVSLALLIGWLIVIFVFSNMNGASSSNLSKSIITSMAGNHVLSKNTFDLIHLLLRKTAHIVEYFVLCLLTYNYLRFYINKDHLLYLFTIISSFVCSIIDEMHQLLINGRTGKIVDIFIDGIGIVICLIVIIAYKKNVAKRKSN